MKLHLGCGNKRLEGFINVDLISSPAVDLVEDASTLHSIESNSVDLIYASHILEHFSRWEHQIVLASWYEVLKPAGILRLAVPDFKQIVARYLITGELLELRGLLYGGQDYETNYHKCCWDFDTLKSDLEELQFVDVQRYNWQDTEHASIDDFSQAYLPHMDKANGLLMSLNIECKKPS